MGNTLVTVGEGDAAYTVLMDVEESDVTEAAEQFNREDFITAVREAVAAEDAEVVPMLDEKEAKSWTKADLVAYLAKPVQKEE